MMQTNFLLLPALAAICYGAALPQVIVTGTTSVDILESIAFTFTIPCPTSVAGCAPRTVTLYGRDDEVSPPTWSLPAFTAPTRTVNFGDGTTSTATILPREPQETIITATRSVVITPSPPTSTPWWPWPPHPPRPITTVIVTTITLPVLTLEERSNTETIITATRTVNVSPTASAKTTKTKHTTSSKVTDIVTTVTLPVITLAEREPQTIITASRTVNESPTPSPTPWWPWWWPRPTTTTDIVTTATLPVLTVPIDKREAEPQTIITASRTEIVTPAPLPTHSWPWWGFPPEKREAEPQTIITASRTVNESPTPVPWWPWWWPRPTTTNIVTTATLPVLTVPLDKREAEPQTIITASRTEIVTPAPLPTHSWPLWGFPPEAKREAEPQTTLTIITATRTVLESPTSAAATTSTPPVTVTVTSVLVSVSTYTITAHVITTIEVCSGTTKLSLTPTPDGTTTCFGSSTSTSPIVTYTISSTSIPLTTITSIDTTTTLPVLTVPSNTVEGTSTIDLLTVPLGTGGDTAAPTGPTLTVPLARDIVSLTILPISRTVNESPTPLPTTTTKTKTHDARVVPDSTPATPSSAPTTIALSCVAPPPASAITFTTTKSLTTTVSKIITTTYTTTHLSTATITTTELSTEIDTVTVTTTTTLIPIDWTTTATVPVITLPITLGVEGRQELGGAGVSSATVRSIVWG